MADMLTAKDVQDLLQVDRSTVYRMAEAGRLPAIKVGKQWRFPAAQIQNWVEVQVGAPLNIATAQPLSNQTDSLPDSENENGSLANLLPLECVQLIQDSHADLLGVMLVITDMQGNPIRSNIANSCSYVLNSLHAPNNKCNWYPSSRLNNPTRI